MNIRRKTRWLLGGPTAVLIILALIGGVAYACVTNGITSSAACGVQVTWTAYVNPADTGAVWGSPTTNPPNGVTNFVGSQTGTPYSTTTFVPGTTHDETLWISEYAVQGGNREGTTHWHSQEVDAYGACNPKPGPTVTASVPVPGPTVSVPVPGPTVTETTTVTVTDTPAPGPTVTVTATPKPRTPAPPKVIYRTPKQPTAIFQGPCGDPFYRAALINPTKHAVTFRLLYTSFKTGKHTVVTKRVAAGKIRATRYVHVKGSTFIEVKDARGAILDAGLAAAPGEYKVCRI